MRRKNAQIVWKTGGQQNTQPSVPHTNRGLPSVVSFFDRLPNGFTEASYHERMVPGALFIVPKGMFLTTGVWKGTDSDQIGYISRARHNPNRTFDAVHTQLNAPAVALFVGQQRITEWDGKGWSRVIRSMFVINGSTYASLSASCTIPSV